MPDVKPHACVALLADLVGSRAATDRTALQQRVRAALTGANERFGPLDPLRATVGDEFQGLFASTGRALAASYAIRLALGPHDGVRFGLATCYDVRFPELFKHLAQAGAEAILVPASWANGPGKAGQWRALCVARALDSTCFIVAPGQGDPATVGVGAKPGSPTGVGHSVVVSPLGEVLAEAGAAPELVVFDLATDALAEARERLPVLAGSRLAISPP